MMEQFLALLWIVLKILLLVLPLMGAVAYLTYAERRIVGFMQCRVGPNRVGIAGLGQPIADAIKLLFKELIVPSASSRFLFVMAPVMAIGPSLAAWAVIPFNAGWVISDINAGVLYVLSMTSLSIYGVLIAGWATNSKYALLGAIRAAAQMVSYEIAMGFALVGVLLAAGSMNLSDIVFRQQGGIWHWYWLPLLPLCVVYWISGVAETNRLPFDMAEGESEIVAGFHVEYSAIAFALFFLAEYANMILIATLMVLMFFGGWLSPFEGIPLLHGLFSWVPGIIWLLSKVSFFLLLFLWMRATFPRYRYDQVMQLGWKWLIPLTLVWIVVVAFAVQLHLGPWFNS